jgi:hypothetical protein
MLPLAQAQAARQKAAELGVSLGAYVLALIEDDLRRARTAIDEC